MRTLVAFLLLALSACTHPPDVSTEFAPVISDMAHKLLASGRSGEIPQAEWPPAIADELHPEAIRLHEEGVYIMTSRFFVEEAGVFVPRHPQQFTPGAGGDPEYRHVALDVYTYMIKG
jgi:hypothetical protein